MDNHTLTVPVPLSLAETFRLRLGERRVARRVRGPLVH